MLGHRSIIACVKVLKGSDHERLLSTFLPAHPLSSSVNRLLTPSALRGAAAHPHHTHQQVDEDLVESRKQPKTHKPNNFELNPLLPKINIQPKP